MAKNIQMSASKRERAGKGVARALRREDKIPAVIYGDKKEPVTISMTAKEANLEFNKGQMLSTLCELDVDGEKTLVLARDVQLHPVRDNVLHIDFLRVSDKTTITVAVPVNFINQEEAKYQEGRGVFNINRYEVDVVCKAKNIPDEIIVDVKDFEIGDSVKISNATMPDGARPAIDDRDFTIATISAPRSLEELEAEEAAEGEEGAEGEAAEGAEGEKAEGGDAPAEEAKSE